MEPYYFDPFEFVDENSNYHLIAYLMVDSAHSMGKTVSRVTSLHHLIPFLQQKVGSDKVAFLDLTGKMNMYRSERWYAGSHSRVWITSLRIHSISPFDNLHSLRTDSEWIGLKQSAKVVVVYGLHQHQDRLTAQQYRNFQRELLFNLPQQTPIYWMIYPERDPRHLKLHYHTAIRPFRSKSSHPDYYSVLPLHLREILINLPIKLQGKSLLTVRDDQRIIMQLLPKSKSSPVTIPSIWNQERYGYKLCVTTFIIPVMRDYCYWFENIHSIPGARSHELLEDQDIDSWIDDYLIFLPWYHNHLQLKDIPHLDDLVLDHSAPISDYFHRIIVDEQTLISFSQLLREDDTRIADIRHRIRERQYIKTTGVPLRRKPNKIYLPLNPEKIRKKQQSSLKASVKAVHKYLTNLKICKILITYLQRENEDTLFQELDGIMMKTCPNIWIQLREAISWYQKRLRSDWQVPYIPPIGSWLRILALPALLEMERTPPDIFLIISKYFSLIDRDLGLINPTSFKFERKKIIEQLTADFIAEYQSSASIAISIAHQGRLHYYKNRGNYIICVQFDTSVSTDLTWFSSREVFPTDLTPQVHWYHENGINQFHVDYFLQTKTSNDWIITREGQHHYFHIFHEKTWQTVGIIDFTLKRGQFVQVTIISHAAPSRFQPDFITPSDLPGIDSDSLQTELIRYYHARISLGQYTIFLSLYPSDEDDTCLTSAEFDSCKELMETIKREVISDQYDFEYRFLRFDIGYEGEFKQDLQLIFDFLLRSSNHKMDSYLQLLPDPEDLYEMLSSEAITWKKELKCNIQHFPEYCIATKLSEPSIDYISKKDAKILRSQGYFHLYCFGMDDLDPFTKEYFESQDHLEIKFVNNTILFQTETLSLLYFLSLQYFDGWLLQFNFTFSSPEVEIVAREDPILLEILRHMSSGRQSTLLTLLKFGSFLSQRYMEITSLKITSSKIYVIITDSKTDHTFDIDLKTFDNECEYTQYIENLLSSSEEKILILFDPLDKYKNKLLDEELTLADFPSIIEQLHLDIESHNTNCLTSCDPQVIMLEPSGFDIDFDEKYYLHGHFYDSWEGIRVETFIKEETLEEFLFALEEMLDTEINGKCGFEGIHDQFDFLYTEEEYHQLIDIYLDLILDIPAANINILEYFVYYKISSCLDYLQIHEDDSTGDKINLFKHHRSVLTYTDTCQVEKCYNPSKTFHSFEIWHIGLCSQHLLFSRILVEQFWMPESSPKSIPFCLSLPSRVIKDDDFRDLVLKYFHPVFYNSTSCIFQNGCDPDISSKLNLPIFGKAPRICFHHFSSASIMYIYEFMISNTFTWLPEEGMMQYTNIHPNKIDIDIAMSYLIMALNLEKQDLVYHYAVFIGFYLFNKDLILSHGFLEIAQTFIQYYNPSLSTHGSPIFLNYLMGRNMNTLGKKTSTAHIMAIDYFEDVLDNLKHTRENELSLIQTYDYLANSLLELGRFDKVLNIVPTTPPLKNSSQIEKHWIEIKITHITALFEHMISTQTLNKEELSLQIEELETYLGNSKYFVHEDLSEFKEKISKLYYLQYRYNLLFNPYQVFELLSAQLTDIFQADELNRCDYLIIRAYCHHALVEAKPLRVEIIELFDKKSINLPKNMENMPPFEFYWHFDTQSTLFLFEQDLDAMLGLLESYVEETKKRNLKYLHRYLLVKIYMVLNDSKSTNPQNFTNTFKTIYTHLEYLFDNILFPNEADQILNPAIYFDRVSHSRNLQEEMRGILEKSYNADYNKRQMNRLPHH